MSAFDRFAAWASGWVSRAPFFAFAALLVIAWLIGLPFYGPSNQLYHLVLNSPTTAITFLLVALLQNTQERFERATNAKSNATGRVLVELADVIQAERGTRPALQQAVSELRKSIEAENKISA